MCRFLDVLHPVLQDPGGWRAISVSAEVWITISGVAFFGFASDGLGGILMVTEAQARMTVVALCLLVIWEICLDYSCVKDYNICEDIFAGPLAFHGNDGIVEMY